MNMINVRRLTVIAFLGAGMLPGISAQNSSLQVDTLNETKLPAQWDLQSCIDYALEQNITIRKNRVTAASTQIDVKTAKAALFPSLSFSTSQQVVNRPYQESSSRVSGSEIISTNSKTSYNGNYGLNASWTLYNGSKRLKTIQQEKLNNQVAELDVATSENSIQESIAQIYIQILYAAESVRVNENTLQVSIAQRPRSGTSECRKHCQKRFRTIGSAGQYRPLPTCHSASHSARLQITTETIARTRRGE